MLLLFITIVAANCPTHCRGSNNICDAVLTICNECEVGWFGNVCNLPCPYYCKISGCDRITGICKKCDNSTHSGDQCRLKNNGTHISCASPYYKKPDCIKQCPRNCRGTKCNETGGCSIGCVRNTVDNRFCGRIKASNSCDVGYFGSFGICYACSSTCKIRRNGTCLATNYCYECQQGYTDRDCLYRCSDTCYDDYCDIQTRKCTLPCRNGFEGDFCSQVKKNGILMCRDGYYGDRCNEKCPENCLHDHNRPTCDKDSGNCNNNCKRGFYGSRCSTPCSNTCYSMFGISQCYRNGTCKGCPGNKHGIYCRRVCPDKCKGAVCDQFTGICNIGCTDDNRSGPTCNITCPINCAIKPAVKSCVGNLCTHGCAATYYGMPQCLQNCSDKCLNSLCHSNGSCVECPRGKHGVFCNSTCPPNCLNENCNQLTYECTDGCATINDQIYTGVFCDGKLTKYKPGYYGNPPIHHCGKCTCDQRNGKCSEPCQVGWFGVKCNIPCSKKCKNGCDAKGACVECHDQTYSGDNCNTNLDGTCRDGYFGEHCAIQDNILENPECITSKYGQDCNLNCPEHCKSNTRCSRTSGKCVRGCIDHWRGQHCNISCSNDCAVACDQFTGACYSPSLSIEQEFVCPSTNAPIISITVFIILLLIGIFIAYWKRN